MSPPARAAVPSSATPHERHLALISLARSMTASLDLGEVVERVLEGSVRFSGAERALLFLRDGDRLAPWAASHTRPTEADVSQSVAEEVARSGRTIYRAHLGGAGEAGVTDSIVRLRLQTVLCVPLRVRQDVIGVVYLDSRRALPHESPDLELLEALAGLAAIAIQNSRLVEEKLRAERTLALGQMARAVVHDLKSPLAAVRAIAELLRAGTAAADPSRRRLETLMDEVDRMSQMANDLLRFAGAAPPLERVPVALADLVRRTLEPLRARAEASRVVLTERLETGVAVLGDAPRLMRVLHNLVANALEAMPGGGGLTVVCARENGGAVLRVIDQGCGMPEDVRRRIFEPLYTHNKPGGSGLGLSIARAIVEDHGGAIAVDSAPGRGTTVSVRLPAA